MFSTMKMLWVSISIYVKRREQRQEVRKTKESYALRFQGLLYVERHENKMDKVPK